MARHREHSSDWLWILPSLLIPLVIAAVAWTGHVSSEGAQVAPNVTFAGVDISGLAPDDAAARVSAREQEFLSTPVVIDLGDDEVALTADELGYHYLFNETVTDVVSARHYDDAWDEFVAWATAPFTTVTIGDHYSFDEDTARQRLAAEDFVISEPVEPGLSSEDSSEVYVIPGVDGVTVNIDQVVDDLARARILDGPVEVTASRVHISPEVTNAEAGDMAASLNEMTGPGFLAVVGDRTGNIPAERVRSHLITEVNDGSLSVSMDMDAFQAEVEAALPGPVGEFVDPEFDIVNGEVRVVTEGRAPPVCCSRESVEAAVQSYLNGGQTFYLLETRPDDDPDMQAWAEGTQIKEVVSEFTTNHPCCANRVTNIHTIADAVRGVYIIPGETFSLNDHVGRRTAEKGYLPAGAIRSGHMTDEIGGGVSQFVTTIFNAAFFGGLDLDEYQSHSIYFSRYPYGREATLSVPGPDLVLTNSTDYPVLVWPTYTDTSITVRLYSTKNVEVKELEQRLSHRNQCTHSAIDRQRTFSDGRVEVDTIVANYRPADGIDCNGNPIPQT